MSKKSKKPVIALETVVTVPAAEPVGPVTVVLDQEDQSVVLQADPSTEDQAPVDEPAVVISFAERLAAITDAELDAQRVVIAGDFDERASYEADNNEDNLRIQDTLKKCRASMIQGRKVGAMLATATSSEFINRSISANKRYNVYAIEKVADVLDALNGGVLRNAITNAIMRSMFQFRAAGEVFNGEMAKAAASDKIRVQGNIKNLLVRYTVSSGTAPTQSSSSLQALATVGIVENKGSPKFPVYELTDTPQTKVMEEYLFGKAA